MLQFIFGRAASGKTTAVVSRLKELSESGKEAILIVPEQFSFDTERDVLHALGDKNAFKISVMSFTRLCDEVERQTGGGCGAILENAHKLILLNRAIRLSASELKLWKRYTPFSGFVSALLESIEEFKLNAVTPEQLRAAALVTDSSVLSAKLCDTAAIMSCYNALISERFIDPSDKLAHLADLLLEYRFFENKIVFLDSFKGFTGQQYKIIERIASQASEITVCLPLDSFEPDGAEVFSNIRKTAERIRRIAAKHGIEQKKDIFLGGEYFRGRSIASAEHILSGGKGTENDGTVMICRADTIYDEAEFAARTIRRLVRKNPEYRFRDFVIIARSTEAYEEAVASACERNGVSCFYDVKFPLSGFPPAAGLIAALEAVNGYETEQILRYLKSGIGPLSEEDVSDLENYTALWGINGTDWLKKWDMNPNGFVSEADTVHESKSDDELQRLNHLREQAVNPLIKLSERLCGSIEEIIRAIYGFFSVCRVSDKMRRLYSELKERGSFTEADALRQSWDELAALLQGFAECYGEKTEFSEFCEALKKTIDLVSIGTAPQMLDQVTFGAADRIRPARPKFAFILGANSGVFPKNLTASGLFANAERKSLIEMDIEIPDRGIAAAIDEEFLVYTNFCCASDRVYVSYSRTSSKGESAEPAAFVELLSSTLGITAVSEPTALSVESLPETENSAFSEGCKRYSTAKSEGITLFSALQSSADGARRLKAVLNTGKLSDIRLSKATAGKLYGEKINMSASRLDTFYRCRFRHFCRYGLKTKTPQPADINAGQRGLIVHYALQKLIEAYGKRMCNLSDEQIVNAIKSYVSEYLTAIPGYTSAETPYLRFLSENIARSTGEVAIHLKKEFLQCEFEPCACEFHFGDDYGNSAVIPFSGGELHLNGMIDRIDTYSGYLRIVDYKTGSRSFRLSDIIIGQNMQMLMYLYAVLKDKKFSGNLPAGILYMPAKRDKGDEKQLKMNGLIAADEQLVCAMEKKNAGEFVPKLKLTADGEIDSKTSSAFVPQKGFEAIFAYLEKKLKSAGEDILAGDISIAPVNGAGKGGKACEYCDFAAVCRIEDEPIRQAATYNNEQVLKIISDMSCEGEIDNGI